MTPSIRRHPRLHRNRGLSLIELMVALALGTILMLGLVEIFGATRASFQASEGLARVQENSRFAMEFIRRDARMAGHMGCQNEFGHFVLEPTAERFFQHFSDEHNIAGHEDVPYELRMDLPFEVFDYVGTEPGDSYTVAADPDGVAAGNDWTPDLPTELGITSGGAGAALPGSDVLVVRYFDEQPILLRGNALRTTPANGSNSTIEVDPAEAANIAPGSAYGLTNCKTATLFAINAGPGAPVFSAVGSPNAANTGGNWWSGQETYGVGSMLFRYRAVVYYVGENAQGGPSLYRRRLADGDIEFGAAEELVSGVEMMQILLGLDTSVDPVSGAPRRDDVVDVYSSVTELVDGLDEDEIPAALQQATSLRLSLLVRSQDVAAVGDPVLASAVIGDMAITAPTDRRMRHHYENLIAIRNRVRN